MTADTDSKHAPGSGPIDRSSLQSKDDAPPPPYQAHPLGPLSAQEIIQSSSLIKAYWPAGTDCHFKVITLLEPAKAELIPYLQAERAGQSPTDIDRRAFVVYYFRRTVSSFPFYLRVNNIDGF